jgi:hypothetical protein
MVASLEAMTMSLALDSLAPASVSDAMIIGCPETLVSLVASRLSIFALVIAAVEILAVVMAASWIRALVMAAVEILAVVIAASAMATLETTPLAKFAAKAMKFAAAEENEPPLMVTSDSATFPPGVTENGAADGVELPA